jgi:hypothetical protein
VIELPNHQLIWADDPLVMLPADLANLYERARHCFIVGEEFARTNHKDQLARYRAALEAIMVADRTGDETQYRWAIDVATDTLGYIATRDFERPARRRLKWINVMWRLKPLGTMFRDIGDDAELGGRVSELRKRLAQPDGLNNWFEARKLSCDRWLEISKDMEEAYMISRTLLWDMSSSPMKLQPAVILLASVLAEIVAAAAWVALNLLHFR